MERLPVLDSTFRLIKEHPKAAAAALVGLSLAAELVGYNGTSTEAEVARTPISNINELDPTELISPFQTQENTVSISETLSKISIDKKLLLDSRKPLPIFTIPEKALIGPNEHGLFALPVLPEITSKPYRYKAYTSCSSERYATKSTVEAVFSAAVYFNALYPNQTTSIGELTDDGHSSHNRGIDFDINTYDKTKQEPRTEAVGNSSAPLYSGSKTAEYVAIMMRLQDNKENWSIRKLLYMDAPDDSSVRDKIAEMKQTLGRDFEYDERADHRDHFHVVAAGSWHSIPKVELPDCDGKKTFEQNINWSKPIKFKDSFGVPTTKNNYSDTGGKTKSIEDWLNAQKYVNPFIDSQASEVAKDLDLSVSDYFIPRREVIEKLTAWKDDKDLLPGFPPEVYKYKDIIQEISNNGVYAYRHTMNGYDKIPSSAEKWYFTPNQIALFLTIETGGVNVSANNKGAIGVAQILRSNSKPGTPSDLTNPKNNITRGMEILADMGESALEWQIGSASTHNDIKDKTISEYKSYLRKKGAPDFDMFMRMIAGYNGGDVKFNDYFDPKIKNRDPNQPLLYMDNAARITIDLQVISELLKRGVDKDQVLQKLDSPEVDNRILALADLFERYRGKKWDSLTIGMSKKDKEYHPYYKHMLTTAALSGYELEEVDTHMSKLPEELQKYPGVAKKALEFYIIHKNDKLKIKSAPPGVSIHQFGYGGYNTSKLAPDNTNEDKWLNAGN